jgi:hypothetical protein
MKRDERAEPSEIRKEYDFRSMRNGVQGKYVERYRAGSNLVLLEEDVAEVFRTDEAVNEALRVVMKAAAAIPRTRQPKKTSRRKKRRVS